MKAATLRPILLMFMHKQNWISFFILARNYLRVSKPLPDDGETGKTKKKRNEHVRSLYRFCLIFADWTFFGRASFPSWYWLRSSSASTKHWEITRYKLIFIIWIKIHIAIEIMQYFSPSCIACIYIMTLLNYLLTSHLGLGQYWIRHKIMQRLFWSYQIIIFCISLNVRSSQIFTCFNCVQFREQCISF